MESNISQNKALSVRFSDIEEVYHLQKDLLFLLQSSLNSPIRNEAGFHVIEMLLNLSDLHFNAVAGIGTTV